MKKFTKMMAVLFAAAVLSVGVLFTACVKKGDGKVDIGTKQEQTDNTNDDNNDDDASQIGVRGVNFFDYYDGVDDYDGYMLLNGLNYAGQAELLKHANRKVFIPGEIDGKKVRFRPGNTALQGFFNVKEVEFESGFGVIGAKGFYACAELTTVTIPDTVTEIGVNAFDSCSALRKITIPNGIEIGSGAFVLCSGLTDIYFAGTAAEWKSVYEKSFSNSAIAYYPTEENLTDGYTQSAHYAVTAHCTDGDITIYSVNFTVK